jgi:uncharacterized membrane protein YqiK
VRAEAEATATRLRAEAEADATRLHADADAQATRELGAAKAQAYRDGVTSLGEGAYTAMQLAATLAENHVKLVPDIAVSSGGNGHGPVGGGLAEVLIARLLSGAAAGTLAPVGAASAAPGADGKLVIPTTSTER